jgi:hypothetical protein
MAFGNCNYNGEEIDYVYVIEGCQMVAISLHLDDMWLYFYPPMYAMFYVNLMNGIDTPLDKNATYNPDYIVGDLIYNELRISVS